MTSQHSPSALTKDLCFRWDIGIIGGIISMASFKHYFGVDKMSKAAASDFSGNIVAILQGGCLQVSSALFCNPGLIWRMNQLWRDIHCIPLVLLRSQNHSHRRRPTIHHWKRHSVYRRARIQRHHWFARVVLQQILRWAGRRYGVSARTELCERVCTEGDPREVHWYVYCCMMFSSYSDVFSNYRNDAAVQQSRYHACL